MPSTAALTEHARSAFMRFLADVRDQDMVLSCRKKYAHFAETVAHVPLFKRATASTAARWRAKVNDWNPDFIDSHACLEILCYGAFGLSIAAVPRLTKRRFLFGSSFDRAGWTTFHESLEQTLCAEVPTLDEKFRARSSEEGPAEFLELARVAFSGYLQHLTGDDPQADLPTLVQPARTSDRLGTVIFSNRLSYAIDPELFEKNDVFKTLWFPFGEQLLDACRIIVADTLEG